MTDTPTRVLPPKSLGVNDLKQDTLARPIMFAKVASDTPLEDVIRPSYWQNHIDMFVKFPFAEVTVVREDGTMILKLLCLSAKPGMAVMHVLYQHVDNANINLHKPVEEGGEGLELPPGYKHAFIDRGANKGHLVRMPNGQVLVQGQQTMKQAVAYAIAHYAEANAVPAGVAKETEPV